MIVDQENTIISAKNDQSVTCSLILTANRSILSTCDQCHGVSRLLCIWAVSIGCVKGHRWNLMWLFVVRNMSKSSSGGDSLRL